MTPVGSLVAMLSRCWPFANGSGRILDLYRDHLELGSGKRMAQTSDGFSLEVYADDLIGRHLLLSGRFDRSVFQMLIDHAREGDVLVDIGANIGYVTACFLHNIPRSRAICIEPQPGIIDLLRNNTDQFGDRVEIHELALSDRDGEVCLWIDQANRGASRIAQTGSTRISAVAAEKFFRRLAKVDLIKIDVEGHELPIFSSILPELIRLKPRAILFENQDKGASPDGPIGSLLVGLGYQIFGVDKKLMTTALKPIEAPADCSMNDYIAVLPTAI